MDIYRGTTPTIEIAFPAMMPVASFAQVWVTIVGVKEEFRLEYDIQDFTIDDETNSIYMKLSQEDTLALPKKKRTEAVCEIRVLDDDDLAYVCDGGYVVIYGDRKRDGVIS